jgi:5-carboxymethyl-2-hydroxymuconic-semialdehyde dehydrogenase
MSTATVEGVQVDTRHWINGRRVGSATTLCDVSPIDEQPLAEISAGTAAEVDAAVRAASDAFPAWAAWSRRDRAEILRGIAAGVDAHAEDLAQVETRDNGSLLRSHRRGVMPRVGNNFRFFADYLDQLDPPDGEIRGHRERVTYEPAGVTAIITPWNAPLMLATWRIGPALAAGNTVVAKPGLRSPPPCWPTSPTRRACRRACSTSSREPGSTPAPRWPRIRTSAGCPSPVPCRRRG